MSKPDKASPLATALLKYAGAAIAQGALLTTHLEILSRVSPDFKTELEALMVKHANNPIHKQAIKKLFK